MPNQITAAGLTTKTLQEIIDEILNGTADYAGFYSIYGPNINVGANSPDGQMVGIFAQAAIDVEELCAQIYASFDPDQAIGVVLDSRCAINGVTRKGPTYTVVPVSVTVSQALTLAGLDSDPTNPFTVSDSVGNRFQLVTTYAFGGAGTQSLQFQAATIGPVLTSVNTITAIVTVTLGVTSVNNPSPATVTGQAEESDAALRIRRAQSVANPSRGFLQGLIGALLATHNVTQAIVLENVTNSTDGNGIPGHSIWCIVLGGLDADVASAIYLKRNAGCGMKGSVTVNITQVDSTVFAVKFDRPIAEPLWIRFTATAVTGTVDATYIRTQILALLSYNINQPADASAITALVKQIAPNVSLSAEGVGLDGTTYVALQSPTDVQHQFTISSPKIVINGTPGP